MTFKFVHTADWQIGKPFGGFPEDVRMLLREARLDAVGRIGAVAQAHGAAHVLVAGDVFDSANPPAQAVAQLMSRMTAFKGLTWHLLPGNHDPVQPGGVWDLVQSKLPSSGVKLHLTAEPVEIAPHVVLLPAPLRAKAMSHDPTTYMTGLETADGALRIGFAHGSVQGFGDLGDAAVPIDPARDRLARLDYFALGDWHGRTRISDRAWYSGTPEPDGYKDNQPGSVLAVTLGRHGELPVVTPVVTHHFQWHRRSVTLTSVAEVASLIEMFEAMPHPVERRIIRCDLIGDVSVADFADLDALHERMASLGRYVDWDQSQVRVGRVDMDLTSLGSASLIDIARGLSADTQSSDIRTQTVATEALALISRFARGARP